jgi:hypothetical protein
MNEASDAITTTLTQIAMKAPVIKAPELKPDGPVKALMMPAIIMYKTVGRTP